MLFLSNVSAADKRLRLIYSVGERFKYLLKYLSRVLMLTYISDARVATDIGCWYEVLMISSTLARFSGMIIGMSASLLRLLS